MLTHSVFGFLLLHYKAEKLSAQEMRLTDSLKSATHTALLLYWPGNPLQLLGGTHTQKYTVKGQTD